MKTIDTILSRLSDAIRALSGVAPPQDRRDDAARLDADFVAAVQAAQAYLPEINREVARRARAVACVAEAAANVMPYGSTDGARFPHATPAPIFSSYRLPSIQPLPFLSRPDNVFHLDPSLSHRPVGQPGQPVKIQCHRKAKIVSRPQGRAFRLQRIILWDRPGDWDLHDILVGNQSQFQVPGRIRGELLSADRDIGLRVDNCQTATDLTLVVEYVGGLEEGAVFDALAIGSVA